ncbi:enoyl-CoA hydratase-related protein [Zhenpiania hominis]|uniref:enoyl-CoA hydratase-related protein n=1 Tax=Zhenpiania hominis TaxID=2763644 RepID=UPI0039F56C96
MQELIQYNVDNQIAVMTINRPEALNALNGAVLEALERRIDEVAADGNVKALILTGAGRAFVAGADIEQQSRFDLEGGRAWGRRGSAIFRKLELLEVPTIAAVNGFALGGGCELALACDLILAGEKAKFGQPEVGLGITPGFSGTQRLPRRVGIGKAKELIFTGKMIGAQEAERIGLVNQVLPQETLLEEAQKLAEEILSNGPTAVKYAKAAINRGYDMDMDTAIAIENEYFAMCFVTEDQKEGMTAFLEKRTAEFKGK